MRKVIGFLLAASSVFIFSVGAFAATIEDRVKALEDTIGKWSFYGSARFATFYEESNSKWNDNFGVTDGVLTSPDSKGTRFGLEGNSRIGARVNKGDLAGRFELGLREDKVANRLMYGTYTNKDVTYLFGQDYAPLGDWAVSNQVFYWDNDMCGFGVIDEDRTPQVKITYKGLQVAFVQTNDDSTLGLEEYQADNSLTVDATTETVLPHLEVRYGIATDKFFADVFGGFGTYKVKSDSLDIDESVNSYALGLNGGLTLNPVYVNAMIWMAKNGPQMGLNQADAAGAQIDADGDITDDDEWGGALVVGTSIDKITVEAGYGYVQSKLDVSGAKKDNAQNYYMQAVIPVAATEGAKFVVIPEIGGYDYMDDAAGETEGKAWYAGAQWRVDF